eukprot:jgi/Mesvir1/24545/Mv21883-RA.1
MTSESSPRERPDGNAGAPTADVDSRASLDDPNFDVIEFINRVFPTEASLAKVDPLIQKLKHKIRSVDARILQSVRQQSTSGTKAKADLEEAIQAVQQLFSRIKEIKQKAEQSEVMVQEMCRDIKKLDFAKKHLTTTITQLRRLSMLVSAVDQLEAMAEGREYHRAAGLLEAVNQLATHFEVYEDVPQISQLRTRYGQLKGVIRAHIFEDFSCLTASGWSEAHANGGGGMEQRLKDACLAVDALEPQVREELISTVCGKDLTAYQQIFQGGAGDVAKLDKIERRYAWVTRQLTEKEKVWEIFPPAWHVPQVLCIELCKVTRAQIAETLDAQRGNVDVATLLQALQRTLDFEQELVDRFGTDPLHEHSAHGVISGPGGPTSTPSASQRGGGPAPVRDGKDASTSAVLPATSTPLLTVTSRVGFKGIISSSFEQHMSVYVELEEKTLMQTLDRLITEETWSAEGRENRMLSSSTQLFLHIKRSFKRCSALTKAETLFQLSKVFQRVLKAYATKLSTKLPRTSVLSTNAGTDWHVKMTDREKQVTCYIVNTAEYCVETVGQLGDTIGKVIDPKYQDKLSMQGTEDEFSSLIGRSISILVLSVETQLDGALQAMQRVNWGALEGVGDQSEYVNAIAAELESVTNIMAPQLTPTYFRFFCDKLAGSFAPRFYANIFKCRRVSETGAQQLLLDSHAVKTLLLNVAVLPGETTAPASYTKFVIREMAKSEALLKVILSPVEGLAETYCALLPETILTASGDFQKVLELKGLRRPEQTPHLEQFAKICTRLAPQGATIPPPTTTSLGAGAAVAARALVTNSIARTVPVLADTAGLAGSAVASAAAAITNVSAGISGFAHLDNGSHYHTFRVLNSVVMRGKNGDHAAGLGPMSLDEVETVRQLLDAGADPNARDCFERSPLGLLCAERPNVEVCAALLDKGADIRATDIWGRTPLHWCADRGHADLALFLIQRGADVHLSTSQGDNCALWAAKGGHVQVAKLLLDAGCDPTVRNNRDECALEVALDEGGPLATVFAAWLEKNKSATARGTDGAGISRMGGQGGENSQGRHEGEENGVKTESGREGRRHDRDMPSSVGGPATSSGSLAAKYDGPRIEPPPQETGIKRVATAERPQAALGGLVSPPEAGADVEGSDRRGSGEAAQAAGNGELSSAAAGSQQLPARAAGGDGPAGGAGVGAPGSAASGLMLQRPFGAAVMGGAQKQGKKLKITLKPKESGM